MGVSEICIIAVLIGSVLVNVATVEHTCEVPVLLRADRVLL